MSLLHNVNHCLIVSLIAPTVRHRRSKEWKEMTKDQPFARFERKTTPGPWIKKQEVPTAQHTEWVLTRQNEGPTRKASHPPSNTDSLGTATCCMTGCDGDPKCPHPADLDSNPALSPPALFTWAVSSQFDVEKKRIKWGPTADLKQSVGGWSSANINYNPCPLWKLSSFMNILVKRSIISSQSSPPPLLFRTPKSTLPFGLLQRQ